MKKFLTILLALATVIAMVACAAPAAPATEAAATEAPAAEAAATEEPAAEATEAPVEVQKVVYAFPGTAARQNFVNDDGTYAGYEIDIVKELDSRIEDYEFEFFCTGEFSALTPGLDSQKFDMVGSNITWNPERDANYLYSTIPYMHTPYALGVRPDETEINSLEDLCGRKMIGVPGVGGTLFLESFNEKHADNPIKLEYIEINALDNMALMLDGRCDAVLNNVSDYALAKEERGYDIKIIDLDSNTLDAVPEEPDSFFLFRKDRADLQQKVDACLNDMRADGTLSELCMKYWGMDFSVLPEGYTGYIHH